MNRKVLVVDDSLSVARQLTKIVDEIEDFDVIGHAKNGAEAVKLFKTLGPDIVFMDIVMPMMDGLQALRTLVRLDPEAKVVVISSMGGSGQKAEEALRLGAMNVVSKPFEPDKVKTILKRLFGQEQG